MDKIFKFSGYTLHLESNTHLQILHQLSDIYHAYIYHETDTKELYFVN